MWQSDDVGPLHAEFIAGRLNRRDFIRRGVAVGLSASTIAALAACGASPTPTSAPTAALAPPATPTSAPTTAPIAASPTPAAAAATATRPPASPTAATGAGPAKRGGGGTLKILQWQAMTILNPHLSTGDKDYLPIAGVVYEPLMTVDAGGNFVPVLAEGIPSRENGGLAADGKSATWKLKAGVKWSDGQPLTAADVVSTWEYVTDKGTAATNIANYANVAKVERVDDLTVRFTFTDPTTAWFVPAQVYVTPGHVFATDKGTAARTSPNNLKPVGTGPYKVVDFKPGDTVSYAINENYREANKPSFDRVEIKGGGDAPPAARAVLQTGDYDYGWNLQVEDTILTQLETGGKGVVEFVTGFTIERLLLNFTDPNTEVDGERSSLKAPHPFLTDLRVRQAFALASDRETIVKGIYGRTGAVGVNILNDPPQYRSSNPKNMPEFNLDKANALLDEAGWKKGASGYREKGGAQMSVVYSTTVNAVRQKTQQVIKDGWEKAGIKTELKSVDSGVFFSTDAGNPDTAGHMYVDVLMFGSRNGLDPQTYMSRHVSRFANQKANQWSLGNENRYQNPEFDKLWDQARSELDAQKRAQLFIQMNDIVIQDVCHIPLVNRTAVYGRTKSLQNINYTLWDYDYWNIANWVKA